MQLTQEQLASKCIFSFSFSFTPAATGAATVAEQSFDLSTIGVALQVGDAVLVHMPNATNAVRLVSGRVNTATDLKLGFVNPTAGSLTHPAGTVTVLVVRA